MSSRLTDALQQRIDRKVAEHEFIDRLFFFWDTSCRGALSFQVSWLLGFLLLQMLTHVQDLISGLNGVMFNGLMENIEWFFNLHDKNKDGYLTKDEVLTLSETLLVRILSFTVDLWAHRLVLSSSSGLRSGTRTSAPSAGSCRTCSSLATRCCRRRTTRRSHPRLGQISRI
jgi:hypothetical protein